jgi:hypothetical protein
MYHRVLSRCWDPVSLWLVVSRLVGGKEFLPDSLELYDLALHRCYRSRSNSLRVARSWKLSVIRPFARRGQLGWQHGEVSRTVKRMPSTLAIEHREKWTGFV